MGQVFRALSLSGKHSFYFFFLGKRCNWYVQCIELRESMTESYLRHQEDEEIYSKWLGKYGTDFSSRSMCHHGFILKKGSKRFVQYLEFKVDRFMKFVYDFGSLKTATFGGPCRLHRVNRSGRTMPLALFAYFVATDRQQCFNGPQSQIRLYVANISYCRVM